MREMSITTKDARASGSLVMIEAATVASMPVEVRYKKQDDDSMGCALFTAGPTLVVEIDPELPSHLQVKTLIHELTHLYSNVLDAPLNERQTNVVENIIWLMMRENPDLLEAVRELQ